MCDDHETLPLDHASYQAHIGQLEQAVLTLEKAVDRDLEALTTSGSQVETTEKLLEERNSLIVRIQALPGFESFLMAPSFDTLRSAAAVDFYSRAEAMGNQLFRTRKHGLGSKEYEEALSSVLKALYDLVGQPVIERLRELNEQEQSRIWWFPTSVFCSLPLHAMDPVRSDGHDRLYFSDLYITSYTPTLSALIEACKSNATMPKVLQEMRVVQAVSPSVATLLWETATPRAALEHLRDHRFAHISSMGNSRQAIRASFKLYKGARFAVLDIARAQLPTAEFAFLSACHTAELTEECIIDEGLHLTGVVQYCGFRSVVGTMWAMADMDGPNLARSFYRSVFADK
ncbi:hypothetical protein BC826DRAFT_1105652 [Russula brevipes]|nr:hypothetical protein BC826DRAFT_1105652 [Russula brevipes]